jgi:hypothetical protein
MHLTCCYENLLVKDIFAVASKAAEQQLLDQFISTLLPVPGSSKTVDGCMPGHYFGLID